MFKNISHNASGSLSLLSWVKYFGRIALEVCKLLTRRENAKFVMFSTPFFNEKGDHSLTFIQICLEKAYVGYDKN